MIGVPTIVVVGRNLAEGTIEVRDRRTGEREEVPADRRGQPPVEPGPRLTSDSADRDIVFAPSRQVTTRRGRAQNCSRRVTTPARPLSTKPEPTLPEAVEHLVPRAEQTPVPGARDQLVVGSVRRQDGVGKRRRGPEGRPREVERRVADAAVAPVDDPGHPLARRPGCDRDRGRRAPVARRRQSRHAGPAAPLALGRADGRAGAAAPRRAIRSRVSWAFGVATTRRPGAVAHGLVGIDRVQCPRKRAHGPPVRGGRAGARVTRQVGVPHASAGLSETTPATGTGSGSSGASQGSSCGLPTQLRLDRPAGAGSGRPSVRRPGGAVVPAVVEVVRSRSDRSPVRASAPNRDCGRQRASS